MDTIDKMYQDFTTHIAPKLAEGLVITKDYFIDLFGRYVKYLIVIDSFQVLASVLLLVVALISFKKWSKFINEAPEEKYIYSNELKRSGRQDAKIAVSFIVAMLGTIIGIASIVSTTQNLIKSIYIPEVRIIEELRSYNINK
jgi:hypothetical protein